MQEHDAMDGDTDGGDSKGNLHRDNIGNWFFLTFGGGWKSVLAPFYLLNLILGPNYQGLPRNHPAMKKARESVPKGRKGPRNEIKKPEQILKQRKLDEKKRSNNVRNMKKSKGKKGKGKR